MFDEEQDGGMEFFKVTKWDFLAVLLSVIANILNVFAQSMATVTNLVKMHSLYVEDRDLFHQEAAQEIERITEGE